MLNPPSIGLCDSEGKEFYVGDFFKIPTEINQEVHGDWALFEIRQQGLTPIASYYCSQTGQALPKGMTGQPMSQYYNPKLFCFANDSIALRPTDRLERISLGQVQVLDKLNAIMNFFNIDVNVLHLALNIKSETITDWLELRGNITKDSLNTILKLEEIGKSWKHQGYPPLGELSEKEKTCLVDELSKGSLDKNAILFIGSALALDKASIPIRDPFKS